MSIAKELLVEKAREGYTVCFAEECPLRTLCLRWQVGPYVPHSYSSYRCVNPHFEGVATTACPMYRNDQKVRFAKGMLHIFTDDMPAKVEPAVRQGVIRKTNRTYYFEYRRGARLMPPAVQEEVRSLFREAGWNEEVHFDGYVEDYDW